MSDKWIVASEIADYQYCERAWWLKHVVEVAQPTTEAMRRGTDHHASHGQTVQTAQQRKLMGISIAAVSVALLTIVLLAVLAGG